MSDKNSVEVSVDRRAMRRSFSAASKHYDAVAVLQKEVRERLLERLQLFKLRPAVVLDLGCGTAQASHRLRAAYPSAQVVALDAAFGMLQHAKPNRGLLVRRAFHRV